MNRRGSASIAPRSPRASALAVVLAACALGCGAGGEQPSGGRAGLSDPRTGAGASAGAGASVKTTAPTASQEATAPGAPIEISIIGTNDLHGRLAALPLLGGYMDALRAARPGRVVLVDAGDMFQGTLESNLGEGEAVVRGYRALGYAAAAIGNHEFDYGPVGPVTLYRKRDDGKAGATTAPGEDDPRGALKARAAEAAGAFPVLAANLLEDGQPLSWPNVKPSVLVKLDGGALLGVIGVTTMGTPKATIAANFAGLTVTPLAEAIAREASALRGRGAALVVVAAHAGGDCKRFDAPDDLSSCDSGAEIFDVARALPPGAVDVIVAGHTHQAVAHRVAGVPIIESYANGAAFGRVDLVWDPAAKRVISARIHPPTKIERGATYEGRTIAPSREVAEAVAPAIERAAARRKELLGVTIAAPFEAKYREESSLGNLVASLLLELDPRADVALTNGGGLRADLPAGPLAYGSFYDALPFENRLARVTMTGAALADLMRRNIAGSRGILSVAGVRVVARCGEGGLSVNLELERAQGKGGGTRPVRDTDRLLVLTSDFLATGGDDFGPADSVTIDDASPPYRDLLAELLKRKKRSDALQPADWLKEKAPRIRFLGAAKAGDLRAACEPSPNKK